AATDNTSPRSPRSDGLHPPCSGPARPEHRPAAASRRSLQACIASLPLQSSWMSKTYLKSDHFNGGGSSPSNGSQFVLGKPFANVALSETCFPLFTVGVRCPCCQEQRRDTGYKYSVHRGAFFLSGTFLMKRHTGALGHRLQHCSDQSIWNPLGVCGTDSLAQARVSV